MPKKRPHLRKPEGEVKKPCFVDYSDKVKILKPNGEVEKIIKK